MVFFFTLPSLSKFFSKQEDREERPKRKYRKIRKPMSEEQRLAAAERLKKAREKRMKENLDASEIKLNKSILDKAVSYTHLRAHET